MHGPIRLNLELSPDFMVVPVTYKTEEDSYKMKELVFTIYVDFSDAQGQLTL